MSQSATPPVLRYLRSLTVREKFRDMPDAELLKHFTDRQDEAAFAAIVRRHGGMVLQVCRSLLHNQADAEDAFQAAFLVLARRARSIQKKASLGSWLYGVAYRTAFKAKAAREVRKRYEGEVRAEVQPDAVDELTWKEAQWLLHAELASLPEKYRAPLVLCYLEGKPQEEAERQLGWRRGKLRSMLERARAALRKRLLGRGLGPSAVLLAAVGLTEVSSAAPPTALVAGSVRAGMAWAGFSTAAANVPSQVAALATTVIQATAAAKIKLALCGFLVFAGLGIGISRGIDANRSWSHRQPPAPEEFAPALPMALPMAMPMRAVAFAEPDPKPAKISLRASSTWDQHTPDRAFDGETHTMWNAGDYAPQWIEADLGTSTRLARIRLVSAQLPDGETAHEVWISNEPIGADRKHARLAHTFRGLTTHNHTLSFRFPQELFGRYIQVRTIESPSWIAWLDIQLHVGRTGARLVTTAESRVVTAANASPRAWPGDLRSFVMAVAPAQDGPVFRQPFPETNIRPLAPKRDGRARDVK
jgi:RNA polymerase sigma factor (sigma-70 family)